MGEAMKHTFRTDVFCVSVAAIIAGLIGVCPVPATAGACAGDNYYARKLMGHLASYDSARRGSLRQTADTLWKEATGDIVALAWGADPSLSDGSCSPETHALVHYASAWYDIDAFGNGTFVPTAFRLDVAKTEIGMAQSEAACSGIAFSTPSLDQLDTKLRHYARAQHYDYEAISGYPGNITCQPY